jgi:hypothetical protein
VVVVCRFTYVEHLLVDGGVGGDMPHTSKSVLAPCVRGDTTVVSCTMEGSYPPEDRGKPRAHQKSLEIRFPRSYLPSQHASEAQRGAAGLGTECDVTRPEPSIPPDISSH